MISDGYGYAADYVPAPPVPVPSADAAGLLEAAARGDGRVFCTTGRIGTRRPLSEALAILTRPGAECSLDDGPAGRDLRVDTDGMTWWFEIAEAGQSGHERAR